MSASKPNKKTTTKPTKPVTPPTSTPKPDTHSFKGIFNFGNNGSTLASNPYIAGTYLGYPWSLLNPSQGTYNWTQLDAEMKPWIDNNKEIILRISPSGWSGWGAHKTKSWTPPWVYALGVQSVVEDDQAVKPCYWSPLFLQALSTFVAAFAQRYDSNPHIVCVEIGVGDGGETKPDTRNNPKRLAMWEKIGYTDAVWWDTIQKIIKIYQSSFKQTPLALMPDASFIAGSKGFSERQIIDLAVSQTPPLWLQENGIIAGKKPDPEWLKTTILAEQRLKTSQSGDTLAQDLQLMIDYSASYALCFEEDLANTKNANTLKQYAAMAQK